MKQSIRLGLVLLAAVCACAAEPAKPALPPDPQVSSDDIYQAGKEIFDALAPPEIKKQYAFPDKAQWDAFAARLDAALQDNQLEDLAQYEPEARAALVAMRTFPGNEEYTDWLQERLDYIEAARQVTAHRTTEPPTAGPGSRSQFIPHYDLWLRRLRDRPKPEASVELVPELIPIFRAAGIPPELVWLAEAESSFNPSARSPSGARGLFQLMPETARELGLSTFLPDDRTNPEKSAKAATQLLRAMYVKFGDWPLTLAAYNAGAGRVQRALDQRKAKSFAGIETALPAETRMYVPKVLAMLQVRAGLAPGDLPAPGS